MVMSAVTETRKPGSFMLVAAFTNLLTFTNRARKLSVIFEQRYSINMF